MDTDKSTPATVIPDMDLNAVTGGYDRFHDEATDRYYLWKGDSADQKYVCPNCGRPVKAGFLSITFSCKSCDASWYYESRLNPNLSTGGWKEVSKADYDRRTGRDPYIR